MSHPFAITPCPTCRAAADSPCAGTVTTVGVHRARYVRAMAVYRHERERRWADTMAARAIRNAREAAVMAQRAAA